MQYYIQYMQMSSTLKAATETTRSESPVHPERQ